MDDDATQRRRDALAGGSAPPGRTSDSLHPFDSDGHASPELLSSYLDEPDGVDPETRRALVTHLAGCGACRDALAELRGVAFALAALAAPPLPRSFALTPRQARGQTPMVIRPARFWERADAQLGKLRWATTLAAVLFVVVLGVGQLSESRGAVRMDADQGASTRRTTSGATAADGVSAGAPETDVRSTATAPTGTTNSAAAAMPSIAAGAASPAAGGATSSGSTADAAASPDAAAALQSAAEPPAPTEPSAQPALVSTSAPTDGGSGDSWRIVEAGLALLIAWLLAALLAIPRFARRGDGHVS